MIKFTSSPRILCLVLALTAVPAFADDIAVDPSLRALPSKILRHLGDSKTADEFSAPLTQAFQSYAGADGNLRRADAEALWAADKAKWRGRQIGPQLQYDLNGDGNVDRAELTWVEMRGRKNDNAALAASRIYRFMLGDIDADGTVTFAEMLQAIVAMQDRQEPDGAVALFRMADIDGDGTATLLELRRAAYAAFARVDTNGNGLLDAAEKAAADLQIQQIETDQTLARLKDACGLVVPGSDAQIVVLNTRTGSAVSSVTFAGQQIMTRAATVSIEPGSLPVWLLLGAEDPMLWQLTGATNRLEHVVVLSGVSREGFGAGIVGVARDKVQLLDSTICNLRDVLERDGGAGRLVPLLGRVPDRLESVPAVFSASLPGGSVVAQLPRDAWTDISDLQLDKWQRAQGFGATPVVDVDPLQVAATGLVEIYDVLPADNGVAQLVRSGHIVIRSRESFVTADKSPSRMATRYRGALFEIVKPIPHFPGGMFGGNAMTFVLAKGVPMPAGSPGQSCVLDGETGKPLNSSPLCDRP